MVLAQPTPNIGYFGNALYVAGRGGKAVGHRGRTALLDKSLPPESNWILAPLTNMTNS